MNCAGWMFNDVLYSAMTVNITTRATHQRLRLSINLHLALPHISHARLARLLLLCTNVQ